MDDSRISRLEKISDRLARRAVKVSTGLITPYPISMAKTGKNIQGDLLNYMFPCEGKIIKGAIRFDGKPQGSVSVLVEIFNDYGSRTETVYPDKQLTVIEPNLKVLPWDCLKVSLYADPEHPVNRVWVSLLWLPHVKEITAMSFLIDEIEKTVRS